MKKRTLRSCTLCGIGGLMFMACSSEPKSISLNDLKTLDDSISFAIGIQIGQGQKDNSNFNISPDIFIRSFYQTLTKDEPLISTEDFEIFASTLNVKMQEKAKEQSQKRSIEERAKAALFLEENKTKPGVVETPSGLQYRVIKEGKGKKPSMKDAVKVQYILRLIDGTEIEATSEDRPAEFPLNQLVLGMTEALMIMNEGSKYDLWLPADIAYGDEESGPIAPGSTLHFELELLEILPPKP